MKSLEISLNELHTFNSDEEYDKILYYWLIQNEPYAKNEIVLFFIFTSTIRERKLFIIIDTPYKKIPNYNRNNYFLDGIISDFYNISFDCARLEKWNEIGRELFLMYGYSVNPYKEAIKCTFTKKELLKFMLAKKIELLK